MPLQSYKYFKLHTDFMDTLYSSWSSDYLHASVRCCSHDYIQILVSFTPDLSALCICEQHPSTPSLNCHCRGSLGFQLTTCWKLLQCDSKLLKFNVECSICQKGDSEPNLAQQ